MTVAQVKPELIRWARHRARLSEALAARKIGQKPDVLVAWEQGERQPTFRQAQNLARRFHVPFGYLFLSNPPSEELPIPDLRTIGRDATPELSPDFFDTLNDALRKQRWYREYLEEEGQDPLPFIGRFSAADNWKVIANDIRFTLEINDQARRETSSWEEFLTKLVRRAEDAGVVVLRNGVVENNPYRKLEVEEFRGFALADPVAPVIFINARDAKTAQIFTLVHELAHLWIGQSGVSNPDFRAPSSEQGNEIEVLCNRIAAETLVPADDLAMRWRDRESVAWNVQQLVRHYRVSTLVVLRATLDLGKLNHEQYWEHYQQAAKHRAKRSDGGNFYHNLLARSSRALTLSLISAVSSERIGRREAASLLNVKPDRLHGVVNYLSGGAAANG